MCNLFEGYPTQDLLLLFVNTLFKVDAASPAQQARLKREWLRSIYTIAQKIIPNQIITYCIGYH